LKYTPGEKLKSVTSGADFESGSDYVFVFLPCQSKEGHSEMFNQLLNAINGSNNKYYAIKVDDNDASVFQSSEGEISGFTSAEAYSTLTSDKTSHNVDKWTFVKAAVLAKQLFARRSAQNRHLIIKSCGNCLPYSILDTLKAVKILKESNIVMSSFGDYEMKGVGKDLLDNVFGYNQNLNNVFLHNPKDDFLENDEDNLNAFKFEHKGDLCYRVSMLTKGNVFDANYLADNLIVMDLIPNLINDLNFNKTVQVNECKVYNTPFGIQFTDFTFKQL
jgi:hypothetical protein